MLETMNRGRVATLVLLLACGGPAFAVSCSSSDESAPAVPDSGAANADVSVPPAADAAQDGGAQDAGWSLTLQERVLARSQSPLPPVPPSPTNKYADNAAAAALGQQLYFDKAMAGPISQVPNDLGGAGETGKVSCASCHVPTWGSDTRSVPAAYSLGTSWTTRNTGPVVNVAFYTWLYWDGRSDTLWQQALLAGENVPQQASDRLRIARVVYTKYRVEYEAVFGAEFGPLDSRLDPTNVAAFPPSGKPGTAAYDALDPADQDIVTRVFVNWGKAIEAYERLLVSRNAPWDRFVAGDANAISQKAIHGYKLFVTKGYCISCHSGPLFSDNKQHNIGLAGSGAVPDEGRADTIVRALGNKFRGDGKWSDDRDAGAAKLAAQAEYDAGLLADGGPNFDLRTQRGLFRTKHLRQIEHTAPYMHNGSLATLEDVMALYRAGGGDSGVGTLDHAFDGHVSMTLDEEADVIEFMKTLTGDAPPASLLRDTSKP